MNNDTCHSSFINTESRVIKCTEKLSAYRLYIVYTCRVFGLESDELSLSLGPLEREVGHEHNVPGLFLPVLGQHPYHPSEHCCYLRNRLDSPQTKLFALHSSSPLPFQAIQL